MPSPTPPPYDPLAKRLKDLIPDGDPAERPHGKPPRVLILGGQPGSGKTLTQIQARSVAPPYTATYDGDDNATAHKHFGRIVSRDPQHGYATASSQLPSDFHNNCLDHLRAGEKKYDVIASHPLGKAEWADSWVDGFKQHGYHVSVGFIATHSSNSYLGILHRYQHQRDQARYGRWMPPELHDEFYDNIPDVAEHLESSASIDSIFVLDRNGHVLHENHLHEDGTWSRPHAAREAIIAERNRPPTEAEIEDFEEKVAYLRDDRLRTNGAPEELSSHVDEAERRHRHHRLTADASPTAEDPEHRSKTIAQSLEHSRASEPTAASSDLATSERVGRSKDVAAKLRNVGESMDGHVRPNGTAEEQASAVASTDPAAPGPPDTTSESASEKLRRAQRHLDDRAPSVGSGFRNTSSTPQPSSSRGGRQPD